MGRVRGLSAKGTAATHPVSGKPKCTSALPLLAAHRAAPPGALARTRPARVEWGQTTRFRRGNVT